MIERVLKVSIRPSAGDRTGTDSVRNCRWLNDAEDMKKSSSGFQPAPTSAENANSKTAKITSKSTKASAHKAVARRTGSKVRGR